MSVDGIAFVRQHGALAELAHALHEVEDLDALLMLAARLVTSALEVDFSEVLEAHGNGSEFRLRAGSGWRWDPQGPTRICPQDGESGYGLALAGPVVVRDYRKDVRFFVSPVLLEHGVVSGLRVPIGGPHGGSWGLLGAHTRKERGFLGRELVFMAAVADILAAAIAIAELREALHRG